MAKPAAAPSPVAASKFTPPGVGLAAAKQAPQLGGGEVKVIKWNPSGRFVEPPEVKAAEENAATAARLKAEGEKSDDPAPEGAKEDAETLPDTKPKAGEREAKGEEKPEPEKPTKTEERRKSIDALDSERRRLALEQTLKGEQEARTKATEEIAKFKGTLEKGTLAERLKLLGVDKATLLEKLLLDGDELKDVPAKAEPAENALIASLTEKVTKLEAKLEAREQGEGQAQISHAVATIGEMIKDDDLPLIHAGLPVVGSDGKATEPRAMVMDVAHQLWLNSGKNGSSRDYVKDAAARVEAHQRAKYPTLVKEQPAKTEEDPPPASRANGKRTGSRPNSEPRGLPTDRMQRDLQIKRDMGWD